MRPGRFRRESGPGHRGTGEDKPPLLFDLLLAEVDQQLHEAASDVEPELTLRRLAQLVEPGGFVSAGQLAGRLTKD